MKIRPPKFYLKKLCPECGQGNALVFKSCTSCNNMIIFCEETSTVFADLHELNTVIEQGQEADCPSCQTKKIAHFVYSTGEQIQSAGFGAEHYG